MMVVVVEVMMVVTVMMVTVMVCNSNNNLTSQARAGKMAPRIKVLAAKTGHLCSILGTTWYTRRD